MPPPRRSQGVRDRAAAWLRRHPAVTPRVAALADRVGAPGASDHILRVVADTAVCRLPLARSGRSVQLAMHRVGGRDQCAVSLEADWRAFEAPMPAVFWELGCRLRGQVVDVGANTGIYTLLALLSDRRRRVTAFEPLPAIRLLADNVALGGHIRRACLRDEAVGAQTGTATLFVPSSAPDDYIETSASLSPAFKADVGERLEVAVTTSDAWWASAGRPRVAIVKIDVESREYDVLRGAANMIAAQRPIVFYELLPQGDAEGIADWAREHDFVDVRLRPDEAVIGGVPAFDPEAWNHVLVPRSRRGAVDEVLRRCGLLVSG